MPAARAELDVVAFGNALVDVIAPADDAFLRTHGLAPGSMSLVDEAQAGALYAQMAAGVQTSGGSAANTVAGLMSLGGRAGFVGKVADDALGGVFAHDLRSNGAVFESTALTGGAATGRSLVSVTPDGQRTMATFLGAASELAPADVDEALVASARLVYLEGYLFDPSPARAAFAKAARVARNAEREVALSLSDAFVVGRWREEILAFLPEVDLLFANEDEIVALMRASDFDDAVAKAAALVPVATITRGARGAVVLSGGEAHVAAAESATVVDTTGAGDQFAAGFLFGRARGFSLERCAELGAVAAAEVIGHYGPRPQVSLERRARERGLI